ncbi:uncharacterized protein FOMMEDRAFT_159201 [Fomitiporia mediterranea MF3/22]|uniref:uncharacterized protein n=1 Tax=Fomitiporia mediterranea (strain MF3/22) TaxID=694068 RepID=UPI0004407D4C|nr:uncharacterized protein FOMMEDRAFT_159201 [Fomitiporia mediterranea MF3/22]EJD00496.1 hypothetical protein FOMMEDRAFT_159201 [Fomitiporia mediterranea MF3/22]
MSSSSPASTTSASDADRVVSGVSLRASVLEAALDLGIRNSVMKKWMFNPLAEDEEEEHNTPALTSPSTSEESSMSPYSIITPSQSTYNYNYPYPRQLNPDKLGSGSSDQFSANNITLGLGGIGATDQIQKAPPMKLTLAVPPTRNKLKKQRSPTGYESDGGGGGYLSDGPKKAKVKTKKGMTWRRKDTADGDDESDGGYRSEAISGSRVGAGETKKAKRKAKSTKEKGGIKREEASPTPPLGDRDPGALLATINASVLPDPESRSGSAIGHSMDGYLTDSGVTEKRGRTKKKSKTKEKGKKSRAGSPGEDDATTYTPTKKKSLFRLMGRSVSREGKDRDREVETPPPLPAPPLPMILPIAERFARTGTPTANGSTNATLTTTSSSLDAGSSSTLTKSSSSIELRSVGSLSTLVPPRDPLRSESPWSNRSAPSRIGVTTTDRAGSFDLPRVNRDINVISLSDALRPLANGTRSEPGHGSNNRSDSGHETSHGHDRPTSPTAITTNGSTSPESGKSPTKRIAKLFPFGHSRENDSNGSSSSSKTTISNPNPHLGQRESSMGLPNPFEIAAALTATAKGLSPMHLLPQHKHANLDVRRSDSPESFIIINEEDGIPTPMRQQRFENANAGFDVNDSSAVRGRSDTPSSLADRRRANLDVLDLTPTQSRAGSPSPSRDGFRAARASVLAYYQVPPPSPPPAGPLPPRPDSVNDAPFSRRGSDDNQLLSPGRAYASRSPSPLGPGGRYSRSPSPGMGMGQVRRGRESPFPTRPILPPQDSRELVERVERYKALYAAVDADGADVPEDAFVGMDEFFDKHSSAYIRAARARGEKRVYFDVVRRSYEASLRNSHTFYVNGPHAILPPEIAIEPADDYDPRYNNNSTDFDDATDERLRYSTTLSDAEVAAAEHLNTLETVVEEDSSSDSRSFAASSVYSRYSVLDEGKSATVREGFVRRVAALYGQDKLLREEIPEVPKIPNEFRDAAPAAGRPPNEKAAASALKVTSSPFRF